MVMRVADRPHLHIVLSIAVLTVTQMLAYAAIAHLRQVFGDLVNTPPRVYELRVAASLIFTSLTLISAYTVWHLRHVLHHLGQNSKIAIGVILILLYTFTMLVPPIGSSDNFANVAVSRVWTLYGQNPYVTPLSTFPDDPLIPAVAPEWRGNTMSYGPLWGIAAGTVTSTLTHPQAAQIGLRALNGFAFMAAGFLLYILLRDRKKRSAPPFLLFWLLNPYAVFETFNAGHNDGLLVLCISIFVYGLMKKRASIALPGLVAAILIKYWPLLFVPALLGLKNDRREWYRGILASMILIFSFVPLWAGVQTFAQLLHQSRLLNPDYFSPGFGVIWYLTSTFGMIEPQITEITRILTNLIILAGAAYLSVRLFHRKIRPFTVVAMMAALYFGVHQSWFQPWYLINILPLVLVFQNDARSYFFLGGISSVAFILYAIPFFWFATLTLVSVPLVYAIFRSLDMKKRTS